jgi:5-methylcytosine-specific restriction endonuclease McrA
VSQVAPIPERDPVDIQPRRMSSARRARIIARDGHCTYPGCEETQGLEVDHEIALALGGKDDDANLKCLCLHHHASKTKRDLALIAKAKRRGLKDRGEFPKAKQTLRGRGFERRWTP